MNLVNSSNDQSRVVSHGLSKAFETTIPITELTEKKYIFCQHGSNGRVFLVPKLNGVPVAATGGVVVTARLGGVDEAIPSGEVDLAQCFPAAYEKPRWGGLASHVGVIAAGEITGADEITFIVERY
ncbi:hypothetical protein [Vibrio sp. V08_P9A1T1]|uniref:hypothetical protein n=1 Tax=Vibrio sp. V08_P9A1T1 TaxID=1938663 RepID=UPI000B8E60D6|nr:hypothetical protein [Vibrio sp. V08_P9A1T1]OXX22051.1 hypothetical protein B9J92_14860 [Vibrio sp. V08_P9A1T1]